MQQMITVLDFDDLYDKEEFYKSAPYQRIGLTEVQGTNGYCEDTAAETIRERIRAGKPSHIYFLGSGNYHYVSFLLQKEMCRDFTLVLFDYHTDLQKPLFPELLSCGCWVRRAMDEMEHLKKVILIGTSAAYLREVEPRYRNHMAAVPEEEAVSPDFDWKTWLQREIRTDVYLSLDKDVLSLSELSTNWDQGSMTTGQVCRICTMIAQDRNILGADICGEYQGGLLSGRREIMQSDRVNKEVLECLDGMMPLPDDPQR